MTKPTEDERFKRILTDKSFKGPSNDAMRKYYEASETSSSSGSIDGESDQDLLSGAEEDEEDVPLGDTTDKLAIMNCNWDSISSDDLFVLIQSFLDDNAPGRKLVKLSIHKSNFGEEKMKREEEFGPEIEGMPSDVEDESLQTKEELRAIEEKRDTAIRKYEKQKKLYYYAIADFDSINTASIIYDEMDGVCAGVCAEALELRFVPEDTPDPSSIRKPLSVTTEVPSDYQPPQVDAANITMQHSRVKCTWDEDTPERKIMLKKLSSGQIADLDLAAYLESSESEDEMMDAAALRSALFGDAGGVEQEADIEEENENEDDESGSGSVFGDMEMKFSRNVEIAGRDAAKRMAETGRAKPKDMTLWDQYQVKRKEASKAKKTSRKEKIEQQRQERIAASQAATRKVSKKARREDAKSSSDDEEAPIVPTTPDSRFDKLRDPKFAVDPTHPKYRKTK